AADAIGDEAEIEHHHAPLARDEHVARVEIAVQLAEIVERRDGGRELLERGAQAPLVEALAPARRRGERGGRREHGERDPWKARVFSATRCPCSACVAS